MTEENKKTTIDDEKVATEVNENEMNHSQKKDETEIDNSKTSSKQSARKAKKEKPSDKINALEQALAQKNDQHLRLQAEFDNYRKRTLKEKMDLTKSAGESILINVLPVVDDFERALQSITEAKDKDAVKEGIDLIYKRFTDFLKQNGIKEIDSKEQDFDTDLHEALTKIPAPSENLKGKVVDVIQKGYLLNDKVIRYAKVVIGE